ncbi:MAG: hypothetical protein R6V45_05465 [Oceanipulchritudo sp.]
MKPFRLAIALFLASPYAGLHGETIDLLREDWSSALAAAEEKGAHLYVAFIGEGWSVASDRFSSNILETGTFRDFARSNLVYCPVRARRSPKLAKDEIARLQSLVIHFDIKSYPTFLLIAPDGSEVLRHAYRPDSAEDYVDLLKAILPPAS